MMLALEDSGSRGPKLVKLKKNIQRRKGGGGNTVVQLHRNKIAQEKRAFTNPTTGVVFELSGPFKGLKKKIKAKKEFRAKKQEVRQQNKLARVSNRQEAKTERQSERQTRKATRLDKRTATQENKLQRKLGKREITAAKQQAKIDKAQSKSAEILNNQEAAEDPQYEEASDQLPEGSYDVEGGDYMVNHEDQGEDNTIDVEFDEVPEEELSDLAAGWIDGILKVAKGAAGGIVNAVAPDSKLGKNLLNIKSKAENSKVGKLVKGVNSVTSKTPSLMAENAELKKRVKSLETQRIIYGAAGTAIGGLAGALIGKALTRKRS